MEPNNVLPIVSLVISIVGLTPTLYSFIKERISLVTTDLYGHHEVGFTRRGPHIALYCVFRAIRASLYVKNIDIIVSHVEEKRKISLPMWTFRNLKLSSNSAAKLPLNLEQETTIDLATGFIVSEQQELKKYTVFSSDPLMTPEFDPLNELEPELEDEYSQFFREKLSTWVGPGPMIVGENIDPKIYIEEFLSRPKTRAIASKISEKCWWKEGTFECELRVKTSKPNKLFKMRFSFRLSQANVAALKQNGDAIISEYCGKLFTPFNFVYVPSV